MTKGIGSRGGKPETLKKSEATKEGSLVLTQESAQIIVDRLDDRVLYGYDSFGMGNKSRLAIGNAKEVPVSRAVALLEDKKNVLPLCKAFLRRFGVITDIKSKIDGSLLFNDKASDSTVQPTEMKYAVLRLLGVDEIFCRKNCGYGGTNRITFSKSFEGHIRRVENDRRLFPLKNLKEFPNVEVALNRIKKPFNIPADKIFKENHIPTLSASHDGKQRTHLIAALSMLALALESGEPIVFDDTEVTNPFSPEVIGLIEKKRKEKQATQTGRKENLG
ncbi:MAG: hypothetical protein Q7S01_00670 [bacterium]|nr:hypothetical protein [bacterium]